MKKYIFMSLAAMALTTSAIAQQTEGNDVDPLLSFKNNNEQLKFTIGGRLGMDAAYISSEYTPTNSGYALSDARVRASMTYEKTGSSLLTLISLTENSNKKIYI